MKTFEERYTAWIDGRLENDTLAAFERELSRRTSVGNAETDKSDAIRLRTLLQNHLQAPALTNPDFFNHQLLQRIKAESPSLPRGQDTRFRARPPLFSWGFAQLVGLGAFSLFAAAALYYGLMPPHSDPGFDHKASQNVPFAMSGNNGNAEKTVENTAPTSGDMDKHPGSLEMKLAERSPTPPPVEETADIQATIPDQPTNPTTATPLHYSKPNVNVLWLNGLEYLPNVPETSGPESDSSAAVAPSPLSGKSP